MNRKTQFSSSRIEQPDRLAALFETELLDSPPEEGFDRLTRLTCKLLKAPIALVSLVDGTRQFFKSHQGLPLRIAQQRGTPLSHSFCKFVVETNELLVIGDVPGEPLVCDNPVLEDIPIKAYVGAPITNSQGSVLGSLCAIDTKRRKWTEDELDILTELAGAVETEIKLRLELRGHERTKLALESTADEHRRETAKATLVDILKNLVRDTPQAIAMLDRDMNYVVHSRRWVDDYGLPIDDLTGLCHYDIFPEVPQRFREEHCRAMGGERISNPDDHFVRSSGRMEYVGRELLPWYGPDGKIGGIFILSEVLTEERLVNLELQRTLEQVRANKQKLRQTVEALVAAQKMARLERWTWDVGSGWLYRHLSGETTHEATPKEERPEPFPSKFELKNFLRLVDEQDRDRLALKFQQVEENIDNPPSFSEAFMIHYENGRSIYCGLEARPVFKEGRLENFVGTIQDLTKQHELERQLFQTQKMEALGQMASGVAHDFNNILTVIKGYTDILLRKIEVDSPYYKNLNNILQSSEQGGRLVKQLLLFARKKKQVLELLNIHDLIVQNQDMFQCYLKARVTLAFNFEAEKATLVFHRSRLEQLLLNFVGNAGDAIEGAGRVEISTRNITLAETKTCADGGILVPGEYLVCTISDNGCGIPEDKRAKIFEPLFTTKDEGKGTGLGLSVCASVAKEALGGISLESEVGVGTSFHIYLPLAPVKQA